jgi:hypothetical protein
MRGIYDTVFVTMLYRSQNYKLDTPFSDVDAKAMVLPSFTQFTFSKNWTSNTHEFSAGNVDAKDIRAMFENYLKANINFLETLYTEYYAVDYRFATSWYTLRDNRDLIANANPRRLLHACAGMARQKYEHFSRPFEGKADVLAEHGYDPKQLHHLCRLRHFMQQYNHNPSFADCLIPTGLPLHELQQLKHNPLPYETAVRRRTQEMYLVEEALESSNLRFSKDPKSAQVAADFLQSFAESLLREHLRQLLISDEAYNSFKETVHG